MLREQVHSPFRWRLTEIDQSVNRQRCATGWTTHVSLAVPFAGQPARDTPTPCAAAAAVINRKGGEKPMRCKSGGVEREEEMCREEAGGVRGAAMAGPRLDLCGAPWNLPPSRSRARSLPPLPFLSVTHTRHTQGPLPQVHRFGWEANGQVEFGPEYCTRAI
jgi:hypothetical protein